MQPTLLAIIGKPLAGKDTQADVFVAAHPDSVKISPGHIIREVRAAGESHRFWPLLGPHIALMEHGITLPDGPVIAAMQETIREYLTEGKQWVVLSGFPRTMDQLDAFDEMTRGLGVTSVFAHLEVTDETVMDRLGYRNDGRIDATPEITETRLEEFRRLTAPIVDRLHHEGRVVEIDGEQSIDQVRTSLENSLQFYLRDPEIHLPAMARR